MRCNGRKRSVPPAAAGGFFRHLMKTTPENNLARKVYERFQTRDVFEIAEKSGVSVIYQKWHPVTVGEFDWRAKTICVNENAEISPEKIIAHELGHYFMREFEVKGVLNEESFCDQFADELLKTEFSRRRRSERRE